MIDFDTIDSQTVLYRGQYATVRSAHEAALKDLQITCSNLSGFATGILRAAQPDADQSFPDKEAFDQGRKIIDQIEQIATNVQSLHDQRKTLKKLAWG